MQWWLGVAAASDAALAVATRGLNARTAVEHWAPPLHPWYWPDMGARNASCVPADGAATDPEGPVPWRESVL